MAASIPLLFASKGFESLTKYLRLQSVIFLITPIDNCSHNPLRCSMITNDLSTGKAVDVIQVSL